MAKCPNWERPPHFAQLARRRRNSPYPVVRTMVRIVISWSVMELPLAFKKAQFGRRVPWNGFLIEKLADRFVATVPEEKIKEISDIGAEFLTHNVESYADLRSLAGKLDNLSSLIPILRPFLDEIWAALTAADSKNNNDSAYRPNRPSTQAPPGCV